MMPWMGAHKHTLACVELGKGSVPRCRLTKSVVGPDWWKRPMLNLEGRQVRCDHGLLVFLVNGSYVRNHFDSDWIQGGNGFRYRFNPKNELWIDEGMTEAEWPFVLFHECYETEKMRGGWSYERAHDAAKRAENKLRRRYHPGE